MPSTNRRTAVFLGALTMLLACGGGGGGGGNGGEASGDLLAGTNGSFEGSDTSQWQFVNYLSGTGLATASVVDCAADGFTGRCMRLGGGAFWSAGNPECVGSYVELSLPGNATLSYEADREYLLAFRARGSKAGMKLCAQVNYDDGPGLYHLDQVVDLTTTAADYSLPFTASVRSRGWVIFATAVEANNGGTLEIDDLELLAR